MFSVSEDGPSTPRGQRAQPVTVHPFQAMSQDHSGTSVALGEMPSLQELDECTDESKEMYMD